MYVWLCMYGCACMYVWLCIYSYVCIAVYIWLCRMVMYACKYVDVSLSVNYPINSENSIIS